jgi:predicted ABC-type ATPase
MKRPSVVVIAGPNGAGKSTLAPALLQGHLAVDHFVNADVIASGLSAYAPDRAALAAGRIMIQQMRSLARARESFAFETTLSSRTFAPWLQGLRAEGYGVHLVFLWLPGTEVAEARVQSRVESGGHDIPVPAIRRRYHSGVRNFFGLYQGLTTTWRVYDSSGAPRSVANGEGSEVLRVDDPSVWQEILRAGTDV